MAPGFRVRACAPLFTLELAQPTVGRAPGGGRSHNASGGCPEVAGGEERRMPISLRQAALEESAPMCQGQALQLLLQIGRLERRASSVGTSAGERGE